MIDSEQLKQHMVKAVEEIRATNPMAGSITNTVTIDFVANAQLAVGGSAAMVYLPDEGEALVAGGGAIYLNMGTLFPIYEQTIPRAAKAAHDAGKPWVLDPVGLGIGSLRTQLVNELKQYKPAIVRGNASEIIALAGLWGLEGEAADMSRVRGVDTTDKVDAAPAPASAIRAIAAGKVAAANIDEHLGFQHEIKVELDIPAPRLNNRAPHGRINTTEREACERRCDFEDIECGLTEEGARTEASRCLRCDHYGYGIFRGGRNEKW